MVPFTSRLRGGKEPPKVMSQRMHASKLGAPWIDQGTPPPLSLAACN